jgi:hypothetical protein
MWYRYSRRHKIADKAYELRISEYTLPGSPDRTQVHSTLSRVATCWNAKPGKSLEAADEREALLFQTEDVTGASFDQDTSCSDYNFSYFPQSKFWYRASKGQPASFLILLTSCS